MRRACEFARESVRHPHLAEVIKGLDVSEHAPVCNPLLGKRRSSIQAAARQSPASTAAWPLLPSAARRTHSRRIVLCALPAMWFVVAISRRKSMPGRLVRAHLVRPAGPEVRLGPPVLWSIQ
jgi:hypothetical protein